MIYDTTIIYDTEIFLSADYNVHEGSCITHQIHELEDIHETYGGFPDSYDTNNTLIKQLWWNNTQIDFENLGNQLGIEVITVSSILQPPGNVIPIHRDTFFQIKKKFPNDTRKKVRAHIYLEDWKEGHFLQYKIKNTWYNSTHWKANQGHIWDSNHLHLSANAGMHNKYTLQISGFLYENA